MASPTLDGSAVGAWGSASSGTVTLTTADTNDVIVVIAAFKGAATVTSIISTSGLTFKQRATATFSNIGLDMWWAPSTLALTAEVITLNFSGAVEGSPIAFGVNGVFSITNPFDFNTTQPIFSTGVGPAPVSINTAQADDFIIGGSVTNSSNTGGARPGAILIANNFNAGAGFCVSSAAYISVSSIQSGLEGPCDTNGPNAFILYGDALTADFNQVQFPGNSGSHRNNQEPKKGPKKPPGAGGMWAYRKKETRRFEYLERMVVRRRFTFFAPPPPPPPSAPGADNLPLMGIGGGSAPQQYRATPDGSIRITPAGDQRVVA